ncbi:MAG TPA: phage holin family protein [Polyangiaceae bacterium]|nr:phage holin family protein [Polyangiaceae bacterium]
MAVVDLSSSSPSTGELVKQVVAEARELVTLEVRIAEAELREELAQTRRAAFASGLAYGVVLLALGACVVAVILAVGATVVAALLVAAALAVLAAIAVAVAWTSAPKSLLGHARANVRRDAAVLREHVT